MTAYEFLRTMAEPIPAWLSGHQPGQAFDHEAFFRSRLVYYPGSGNDGHAVKLFGSSHSAHCFIYVDYGLGMAELERELAHPTRGFRGYHRFDRILLARREMVDRGWVTDIPRAWPESGPRLRGSAVDPYGLVEILERDPELDDRHGPVRLAILFLATDGIDTYERLFCGPRAPARPFAVILHDHGCGGNYDRFGNDGLMHRLAQRAEALPSLLLVARGTQPWSGFERLTGVEGDPGGRHVTMRYLHRRSDGLLSKARGGPIEARFSSF